LLHFYSSHVLIVRYVFFTGQPNFFPNVYSFGAALSCSGGLVARTSTSGLKARKSKPSGRNVRPAGHRGGFSQVQHEIEEKITENNLQQSDYF
jgi:hypothetical protein